MNAATGDFELGQIHVVNAIGMRLSVDVQGEQDAFATMRRLGRTGWSPLEVPSGGFRLPLAAHDKFDWSLIGARPLTLDNEHGVMFQGQFYKRREYEQETKGKKLPAAIKYSRGAKKTDDPVAVEHGSGDATFVTLITFKGGGKSIEQFEIPKASSNGAATQRREQPLRGEQLADAQCQQPAAPAGEPITKQQLDAIGKIITQRRLADIAVCAVVKEITGDRTMDYRKTSFDEAVSIIRRLPSLRGVGAA